MRSLSRVVWTEGMHLAQHHFQAQNRYFETVLGFALEHLFPNAYGLLGCGFDTEALRNGVVSLVHARGVMPDGLPFHFPDSDPSPASRDIRDRLLPTEHSRLILLAVPSYRDGAQNCELDGPAGAGVRYRAEPREFSDETTGVGRDLVRVGRKNFRLLLDSEPGEDDVCLPLARVRRSGAGHLEYDPDYIPPCLQIGASQRILDLLARLTEVLTARSLALGSWEGKAGADRDPVREVAQLWMRHTIHSHLSPLRHYLSTRRSSPEQVFADLSRLAGALCTFTLDSSPRDLPSYRHDDLEACFSELERRIEESLEVIAPTRFVAIPLTRHRPFLFTGTVADPRALHASRWILEVAFDRPDPSVASELPHLLKVCSGRFIERLVKEGLPGLGLSRLAVAPAQIPVHPERQYYAMTLDGPCWQSIAKTAEVGLYAPDTTRVRELTILAVL